MEAIPRPLPSNTMGLLVHLAITNTIVKMLSSPMYHGLVNLYNVNAST
jgi:hypothetical protein